MRFFIFPLENLYIAVAADSVKCFVSYDAIDNYFYHNNPANTDFIKIPVHMIFSNNSENSSCHAIVLKQETDGKAIVIITPPVERDMHIEEKEIQSFPESFSEVYSSFSGLCFSGQNIILFLDTEKLTSLWLKRNDCNNLTRFVQEALA